MLNKDSFSFGAIMGTVVPVVFLGALYLINMFIEKIILHRNFITFNSLVLLSIAMNLIVLRYYFVKLKFDKTGRGILILTFIYMILFFVILDRKTF